MTPEDRKIVIRDLRNMMTEFQMEEDDIAVVGECIAALELNGELQEAQEHCHRPPRTVAGQLPIHMQRRI